MITDMQTRITRCYMPSIETMNGVSMKLRIWRQAHCGKPCVFNSNWVFRLGGQNCRKRSLIECTQEAVQSSSLFSSGWRLTPVTLVLSNFSPTADRSSSICNPSKIFFFNFLQWSAANVSNSNSFCCCFNFKATLACLARSSCRNFFKARLRFLSLELLNFLSSVSWKLHLTFWTEWLPFEAKM